MLRTHRARTPLSGSHRPIRSGMEEIFDATRTMAPPRALPRCLCQPRRTCLQGLYYLGHLTLGTIGYEVYFSIPFAIAEEQVQAPEAALRPQSAGKGSLHERDAMRICSRGGGGIPSLEDGFSVLVTSTNAGTCADTPPRIVRTSDMCDMVLSGADVLSSTTPLYGRRGIDSGDGAVLRDRQDNGCHGFCKHSISSTRRFLISLSDALS
jgi:hypothetical protein